MKPVEFLGDSLEIVKTFPEAAKRQAGYQLDRVQNGLEPNDWKPMPGIGAGVCEIRIRDSAGAFRIIYIACLADAVYVLHAFQKKTQKTARQDIERAALRLRALLREQA